MINDGEGGEQSYNGGGESGDRQIGTVNTINLSRGFGFLKLSNGDELFFHNNQIRNCDDIRLLREGDRVEFTLGPDAKNPDKNEAKDAHVLADVSGRRKLQDRPPPRSYRSRTPPRGYHDSHAYSGGGRHGYARGRERDFYEDRYAPPDRYYDRERGRGGYYGDDYPPPRSGRDGPPPRRGGRYGGGPDRYYGGAHEDPYYDRPYPRYRDGRDSGYMRGRERSPPPPRYDDSRGRSPPREEGTVKTLTEKGYGFVDLRGSDYFFPAKEVQGAKFDELKVGEPVSCIIVRDPRDPTKWQAQRVRKAYESGRIDSLKNGFGYIMNEYNEKIFFHKRHLVGMAFDNLQEGADVQYKTVSSHSRRGTYEAQQVKVVDGAHFTEDPNDMGNQGEMNSAEV